MKHMSELWISLLDHLDVKSLAVVTMFRDGGLDHNCKHFFVQMALVMLFIFAGLDTMVVGRTTPNQSWANEAEQVMSVLNLRLQGCALCKTLMDAEFEGVMNSCGGMNAIRKATKASRKRATEAQHPVTAGEEAQPATSPSKDAQQPVTAGEEAHLAASLAEDAEEPVTGGEGAQPAASRAEDA